MLPPLFLNTLFISGPASTGLQLPAGGETAPHPKKRPMGCSWMACLYFLIYKTQVTVSCSHPSILCSMTEGAPTQMLLSRERRPASAPSLEGFLHTFWPLSNSMAAWSDKQGEKIPLEHLKTSARKSKALLMYLWWSVKAFWTVALHPVGDRGSESWRLKRTDLGP